ncbi:hypothetical protein [Brucella anthropi]
MMRYARIENNTVVEVIPVPAKTAIEDMFHPAFVATLVPCTSDVAPGWNYANDEGFTPPMETGVDLEQVKSALKAEVDRAAEAERLLYITPGVGQAMTYQQKVDEARAFKAATNPKSTDYPVLASEVGITAESLAGVADIVLAAFAMWQQIGAMIENIRLGAKRDIDNAVDEAAAQAIVDAIIWPSAQVQA